MEIYFNGFACVGGIVLCFGVTYIILFRSCIPIPRRYFLDSNDGGF
jgi:hypothetical protein